jgi:hypothetical protein
MIDSVIWEFHNFISGVQEGVNMTDKEDNIDDVRFQALAAVSMKLGIFLDVLLCS